MSYPVCLNCPIWRSSHSSYEAIREVLNEAIVVLRERAGADIHVEIRDFLKVHGKGGQPCPRCGTTISEIKARQRLTNFCRQCQPGRLIT